MTLELRPCIGIASPFGPTRTGLRAMLGGAYEILEAPTPSASQDVDLWVLDGDGWENLSVPFLLLSDAPGSATDQGRQSGLAFGVLHRDVEEEALRSAVNSILAGLVVLEPEFLGLEQEATAIRSEELTVREQEVLQLLALGLANKQIAARLGISIHTVKFHAAAILAKLGAASRTEAVTIGAKSGWVVF